MILNLCHTSIPLGSIYSKMEIPRLHLYMIWFTKSEVTDCINIVSVNADLPRLKNPKKKKGTKSLKVPASRRPPSPDIPLLNSSPQPLTGTDSLEEGLTAQPAHERKGRACGPRGGPRKFKTSPQRCRPASLCLPGLLPLVPCLPGTPRLTFPRSRRTCR